MIIQVFYPLCLQPIGPLARRAKGDFKNMFFKNLPLPLFAKLILTHK